MSIRQSLGRAAPPTNWSCAMPDFSRTALREGGDPVLTTAMFGPGSALSRGRTESVLLFLRLERSLLVLQTVSVWRLGGIVQRADHLGRHLGKGTEDRLALRRADMAVRNALLRHQLALERGIVRNSLEALAPRGDRSCRCAGWRRDDVGELGDLVGEPVERIPGLT